MAHCDARKGKWRGNRRMEWVASTLPSNMFYPALLPTIKTCKLPSSMVSRELSSKIRQFQHHCFHITLNLLLTQWVQLFPVLYLSTAIGLTPGGSSTVQLGFFHVGAVPYTMLIQPEHHFAFCGIAGWVPIELYIVERCIVDHNNGFGLHIWNELLLRPFLIIRVVHVVMIISTFWTRSE